jgi:hypothetical protein
MNRKRSATATIVATSQVINQVAEGRIPTRRTFGSANRTVMAPPLVQAASAAKRVRAQIVSGDSRLAAMRQAWYHTAPPHSEAGAVAIQVLPAWVFKLPVLPIR